MTGTDAAEQPGTSAGLFCAFILHYILIHIAIAAALRHYNHIETRQETAANNNRDERETRL